MRVCLRLIHVVHVAQWGAHPDPVANDKSVQLDRHLAGDGDGGYARHGTR
jgi:hypothetical protein